MAGPAITARTGFIDHPVPHTPIDEEKQIFTEFYTFTAKSRQPESILKRFWKVLQGIWNGTRGEEGLPLPLHIHNE
jgi:hypothetical protein